MPVEILTEIMNYLLPLDLLYLARTSKSLRNILMSQSSEPIWFRAARNLPFDFPTTPPIHLDIPYLVSMLFTRTCTECGSQTWVNSKCNPLLGVRLCVDCQPKNLRSELQALERGRRRLLESATTSFDLELWEDNIGQLRLKVIEDSEAVRAVMESLEKERENEIRRLKTSFEVSSLERLRNLGWDNDDIEVSNDAREWRKLTKQPKVLTDRIWKNLYPKLRGILEISRSERIKRIKEVRSFLLVKLWNTKREELKTYISMQFHHSYENWTTKRLARLVPPAHEAVAWNYVEQCDLVAWFCDERESLENLWENIRPLTESWQHDVEKHLANLLQDDGSPEQDSSSRNALVISGQTVSEDLDILLRADSIFQIEGNPTPQYYPAAFLETKNYSIGPIGPDVVTRHPNITHLSMDACGRRFVCGRCPCLDLDLEVYSWEGLLEHYIEALCPVSEAENMDPELRFVYSGYHKLDDFSFLAPEFYPPLYALLKNDKLWYPDPVVPREEMPWLDNRYVCLLCDRRGAPDLTSMLNHVKYIHKIDIPTAHRDFKDYDSYLQQSLEATLRFGS
ncbi:hypothetical protein RSOL_450770 [Rhizoctonia solani AG-3 Rhs1AP]|uniref:F-box domain-containing protein n=1 Tax=Rhizoctonia solani AG-3 Rhs1AP TaxID=1086054 RepID=X8JNZ8_9AGAM|nr:hypothetical protein RSOL_450770 [Rhizoctonia solani AG-3 Rhs1AP]